MEPIWTRVFFEEVKRETAGLEWARRAKEELERSVDRLSGGLLEIPLVGGGWSHDYNCPKEGSRLRRIDRHHHECPTCGAVWSGSPWDEVAVANEHWQISEACRNAAVLFGLDGVVERADWAKRVLFFYADHYEQYPLHDKKGGNDHTSGKVQCQTLSEASWLIPLAQACVILKSLYALSGEQLNLIGGRLLRPAIDVIRRNPGGISNWQTYHNAAKAWTAAALDDRALWDEAVNDPDNGFHFQMQNSLAEDGFWYEGAWGYHFYALEAQIHIVLAGTRFGESLHTDKRFQAMFRSPLRAMFPDGTLPPVHDSGIVPVKKYAHQYEFAHRFIGVGGDIVKDVERTSLYSLLFGAEPADSSSAAGEASTELFHLERAGMLVAKGTDVSGMPRMLLIDYGPHGGGHGHQDKLNLLYYAKDRTWLGDAGMLPYGNPVHHAFFKQTVAHNTMAVNGRSQEAAEGTLVKAEVDGHVVRIVCEAPDTYPDLGVTMRRKLLFAEEWLLDVCEAESERTMDAVDWIIHVEAAAVVYTPGAVAGGSDGMWVPVPDGSLGGQDGYDFVKEIGRYAGSRGPKVLEWSAGDDQAGGGDGVRFQYYPLGAGGDEEWYRGTTPAMPPHLRRGTWFRRLRNTRQARFIGVFRACGAGANLLDVRLEPPEAAGGEMRIRIGEQIYSL
ncbi:heparinase II/III domain-containing protein [Paenibacillus hamazuiensis]|uniref:heparinase II/III domain-containing protein n=1 Tax=Paenibacillus hamazuiensis TaxID=2936508 RepID=UPI00200D9803|nr:heparinase II/III family protein [Paenibacillus hamazuiensis]